VSDSYYYTDYDISCTPGEDVRAFAVWNKGNPYNKVQGARYASGWTIDDLSSAAGGYAKIVADENGNALAIWRDNGSGNLKSCYFSGSSWGGEQTGSSNSINSSSSSLDVAFGPSSTAIAVWHSSTNNHIYANRFTGSWTTQTDISSANGATPRIALDPDGNTFAVWEDTAASEILARRFVSGSSWPNWEGLTLTLSGA
jgi:hypothetical protein